MFHPLQWLGRSLARFLAKPRPVEMHFGTSGFDLLRSSLRAGDVLLVEGSSRFSTAIKYLTQSSWSHSALYVGAALLETHPQLGPHVLIEADVIDGVRALPLSSYRGVHTRICRPVGLDQHEIWQVLNHVIGRLGQHYDMHNVLDLLRYLLPTPPIPGRWRRRLLALGSGEPTEAICSSLIAAAFHSVRYPILPALDRDYRSLRGTRAARKEMLTIRNSKLFTPRDFDISPYFRIVKPMLEYHFDPHRIHWAARAPTAEEGIAPVGAGSTIHLSRQNRGETKNRFVGKPQPPSPFPARIGGHMSLSRLVPMQPVKSMPASVAFYEKLGFAVENRNDEWGWAMLRCGGCQLMLDQSINLHPGIPRISVLYLYPENLADFHRRARENGLSIPELDTTFYGMAEFRMEDPDGNRLWIGQASESHGDA